MGLFQRLSIRLVVLFLLLSGLPLIGLVLSQNILEPYLEFPPTKPHVIHAPFSWQVFGVLAILELMFLGMFIFLFFLHYKKRHISVVTPQSLSFPWWGWLALGLLSATWTLAWGRMAWFEKFQTFTFTPLWLSYIVFINSHTYARSGRCLLATRPGFFLILFPSSAMFWRYFEFLNRLVQNWHYVGVQDFSPLVYTLHSTIAFSTVLPAVLSTTEWLSSFQQLQTRLDHQPQQIFNKRSIAYVTLFLGSFGLLGLARWPSFLFL